MTAAGRMQDYGNGTIRLLPYSDRGRSRITPDDVRRDLAALADMIGNGFDIARVFGTWVFPQTNREGKR